MIKKAIFLVLCALNFRPGSKCRLNTRVHFGEPLPIVIKDGRLLEPTDSEGNIDLAFGDTLTLSCEGSGTLKHPYMKEETTTSTISCESEDLFKNENTLNDLSQFSEFRCDDPPSHASRRTNRLCFENNVIYEVGYYVEGQFYPVYESCFNEAKFHVIYSKYTQKPYNAMFQTKVSRHGLFFIANDVFGSVPIDSIFSQARLNATLTKLLGAAVLDYFDQSEFLSRGHLAAKTDFAFAFGERATFHYVNCAAQWTGFNGGNWNTLEVDLRQRINTQGYNTIIYTGTFGVLQLTDESERIVDIYLYTDENNNPVIPVPLYFYKVVYDAERNIGTAFIGINNPHYTIADAKQLFFCPDVCRRNQDFSWLTWSPDNSKFGYVFCCTISDFRKTVDHFQLDADNLLT